MPWQPLPRIAFAVATYPFAAHDPADLPLELGDELYIIEQGGQHGDWFRGYLVAPPSLLAGLTSVKGQTLEARVFSGIFPKSCVEVREVLGEDEDDEDVTVDGVDTPMVNGYSPIAEADESPLPTPRSVVKQRVSVKGSKSRSGSKGVKRKTNGNTGSLAVTTDRNPDAPKPPAPVPMLKVGDETSVSTSEPLVDEIASCLREWHSTNLHELLLSRQYPMLDKMSILVQQLDLSRRQFLHNVLTTNELYQLREKTVWDLVRGNKTFNGEVIVRDPEERGRVLTADDSAVEITKLQSMMSLLEERPQPILNENLTLHHLLIDVKTFVGTSTEPTTLVFFLASKQPGQNVVALSESYIIDVPPGGALTNLAKAGNMKTLFSDLASTDIGDQSAPDSELYLVVRVRSTQQVVGGKPGSRSGSASRDGGSSRNGDHGISPSTSSKSSGSGRRSLVWGKQGSQRSAFSRNAPISSKLNSLAEDKADSRSHTSQDGPPSTADSKGLGTERKSGSVSRVVTKTVGIGAIKVNSVLKQEEEVESVITIWSPSPGVGSEKQDHSDGWEDVIKELMDSKSGHFEKSRRAERLQVHLRAFNSTDAEVLIKATPTLLSGVSRTSKMGFSGAPTKARSDIYITIDEAFLPRHALLSRSSGSATPLSTAVQCSNLQITLEVRRANGERVENCIVASSNAEPVSSWESTAAEKDEAWNQTLRLCVSPANVPICHISMTLSDAPNGPFAICHMPLWDQQAFMRDGHHSLLLYRYDDSTSSPKGRGEGRTGYLSVPWNARGKDDVSKDEAVTGPIATLRVQTYLCSTRFSQDKVLLGLLKWKEHPGELQELLKRLVFVPEIEIVKLLNDVFDAIFSILVENAGNDDYEDLVFSALVTVLGIVHDRRFNLGPLVDQYAETKFNYPFATPCLVRSFTRLLSNPSNPETSRKLRATFKVVRHILKFITHARGQQKAKEAGIGITSTSPGFTRHLRSIFKSLDGLMRNPAPILVGSQTLAVQHFHTWLPELTGLLSTEEILHIAIDFMDSCNEVKGKLVLYKLVLIINYSKLELFSQAEQRAALSANTVRWIAPHWGKTPEANEQWRDQVRLCCSILSTQVQNLGPEIPDYIPKIIDSYLTLSQSPKTEKTRLSLLFPTTYPFPSKAITGKAYFDEVLVELSAILSAISTLPAGMQLELAEDEMATLLEDLLQVHLSILQCEAFPSNWLSVHIYHHKSTMRTLEYVAAILLDSFLPHPDDADNYNMDLWKAFFTVLLKLVGSDSLALETFPEQKRRTVWKIAGDVREHGAELLRRTWEAIGWETGPDDRQKYGLAKMGGYQVQYVPVLVSPIVELCLNLHEGLRLVATQVLQTMIVSEWTLSEDLSTIQTEMIDCLDILFKTKPLSETILRKLCIDELRGLFEASCHPDDPLFAAVTDLISTIDEFLDLLIAVHSKDVTGEASHMIHRLRLMEFLRDMQKEEIFIRYVHQLAQLQLDARNPTEAALALRLHADLYKWDPTDIVGPLADPEFPAQSHFERRERIYFEMIRHFEEGEAWSSALLAYQELQQQYAENVYDFAKLARTQRSIATVYESIFKSDKLVPKYFKVAYRGMGFPPSLREKEFVFEGSATERTTAFTDRLLEQHPAAQALSPGDVEEVEGQYLQISPLSPHRDLDHHVFQRARIPQVIREYLLSANPQVFSITSKRNTSGPVTEHSAEKLVYRTAEHFPTILRRSEIVSMERITLNPLQTALERIIRKTAEMTAVEKKVLDGEDEMSTLLTDALQISVAPDSETSVARYRDLVPIPSDEDEEEILELTPLQNSVKIALIDHAIMIKRSLSMLAKSNLLSASERESLTQNFEATFAPELQSFTFPQQQRELTPSPSWAIASPVLSTGSREKRMSGMRALHQSGGLPQSDTNGTISSSVLGIPSTRASRNRLSFLKRGHAREPSASAQEAVLAPVINGNLIKKENTNNSLTLSAVSSSTKAGAGTRDSSSEREHGKENRKSFFGSNGAISSISRGRGRDHDLSEKDEETEWVTQSDLTGLPGGGNGGGRRSSSSQRPRTAVSGSMRDGGGGNKSAKSIEGSVSAGSKVGGSGKGSVRKRLSMLKLGKKSSKASVLVGSVVEEE